MISKPFSDNIIGSWIFIRAVDTPLDARTIYHFTADERCYWEVDLDDHRTIRMAVGYRLAGDRLTLIYTGGNEHDFDLEDEEDGTTRWPGIRGGYYWMTRLSEPEPYSLALVDENGHLQKLPGA